MTAHNPGLTNTHTARVLEIEPGATKSYPDLSDAAYAAAIQTPLVRYGLLVDPGRDGDIMADSSIVTVTGTYTHTGAADTIDAFIITGGNVEIYDLSEQVTTALSSDASVGKYQAVEDEGPTTTDMCTTTSVASAAVGKCLQQPALVGSALIVSTIGLGLINGKPILRMGPGKVRLNLSGLTTGAGFFRIRWRKLDAGAVLVANF